MSFTLSQFFLAGVAGPTGRQPDAQAVSDGTCHPGHDGGFFRRFRACFSCFHRDMSLEANPGGGSGFGAPPGGGLRRGGQPPRNGRFPRRHRRGLIGMLLTIVVAVVIIIAVFAAYNQVTASASAAQTAVFVRQLAPQVANEYRGNYDGLTSEAAIRSGFVPDNWHNGTTITDPDGTTVTIASANSNANFTIMIDGGVPSQTCKAVLGALKSDPTFVGVNVGDGSGNPVRAITPADINTECAKTGAFAVTFR